MSANHSERGMMPSEFIKGGGDASCELQGIAHAELIYSPVVRFPKPKSIFGQYRSLPRKPGFVSTQLKVTSSPGVRYRSMTTPRKIKKATSMEDLTPESRKKRVASRVKRTMSLTPATMGGKPSLVDPLATVKFLASRRIFQALILNAWRKRRTYLKILLTERDNFSSEVSNLNVQITVLKTLLDSEKDRRQTAAAQLEEVTAQMDEVNEELQVVRKDKEEIYSKLACQDLRHEDLDAKFKHVKKELQFAKNENCELMNKLQSSEDQVSSLRKKNTHLQVQVTSQNESTVSRMQLIKSLQNAKANLDERLSAQLTELVASRQENEDALESVSRLEEEVTRKDEELIAVQTVNKELLDKIRSLLGDMREQYIELEDAKARLTEKELEMESHSWSHQLRNVVSLVAQVITRVVLLSTN